ncbi:hypothetical protein [Ancylobacter sp. FA202]|uniref:hypothetical protein n=1 Tax=Ancylobacter sp. FA202 TaxID=1111106 RepID=UPI00037E3654|nr:hypothetical protein [Ancylobacter sp. FA202]
MRGSVIFLFAAMCFAGPAVAQEAWPDLLGKWVGKSRAVIMSPAGHYGSAGGGSEPRFASSDLVVEITKQDQGRYIGTIVSAGHREEKLMVVSEDRKTLRSADSDGNSFGHLIDSNSFELCYAQIAPSVASCTLFRREK